MIRKKLSWKPQRCGDLYCAPACGRGCTWAEYQQAHKRGRELAQSLGPQWKPRIWENMGWHYEAVSPCKRIVVHLNVCTPGFWAALGGNGVQQWTADGRIAKSALRNVIAQAKHDLARIGAYIQGL